MKAKGRPTLFHFNAELLSSICFYTLKNYTLKKIANLEGMPPANVIYYWTKKYPCLRNQIALCKVNRKEFEMDIAIESALASIETLCAWS